MLTAAVTAKTHGIRQKSSQHGNFLPGLSSVFSRIAKVVAEYRSNREARRVQAEWRAFLHGMDKRTLQDLGLAHGKIEPVIVASSAERICAGHSLERVSHWRRLEWL